jgi:hypothetical protein
VKRVPQMPEACSWDLLLQLTCFDTMNPIVANYRLKCSQASDINRLLPTLYKYARRCESISEFGVRGIVSTWAFLHGLLENNSKTKELICVDIEDIPEMESVRKIADNNGIGLRFYRHDSATCSIPTVDLLFIDTWHIYGHLKRELNKHHGSVRKYIVMHDTETDGILGESLRNGWNIKEQAQRSGYPEEDIRCGLQRAISEFLAKHPEWKLLRRHHHSCGLTILARSSNVRITLLDRAIASVQNGGIYCSFRKFLLRIAGRF